MAKMAMMFGSPLARGARIETRVAARLPFMLSNRPSQEGRGLKLQDIMSLITTTNRPSQEGRGLKLHEVAITGIYGTSPLARGARIETNRYAQRDKPKKIAPRKRGAD